MAIDTRDKRASVLGVGRPYNITYPNPDGAIAKSDRTQVAGLYHFPVALTQTVTVLSSAAVTRTKSVAKTVTPHGSAAVTRTKIAGKTVTPHASAATSLPPKTMGKIVAPRVSAAVSYVRAMTKTIRVNLGAMLDLVTTPAINNSTEYPQTVTVHVSAAMTMTRSVGKIVRANVSALVTRLKSVGKITRVNSSAANVTRKQVAIMLPRYTFQTVTADSSDGGWTNELGGSTLYTSIDDGVADDADYIVSSISLPDECTLVIAKPTGSRPWRLRYRYKKIAGATDPIHVRVTLRDQAGNEIAFWEHDDISTSVTEVAQQLTTTQMNAVAAATSLAIAFTAYDWTPADLGANLIGWWSADTGVTTSGGNVTRVTDLSGNGKDLVNSGVVPFNQTGLNGRPAFEFVVGNDASLYSNNFTGLAGGTTASCFAVAQMTASAQTYGALVSFFGATAEIHDYTGAGGAIFLVRDVNNNGVATYRGAASRAEAPISLSTSYRLGSVYDGANATVYVNGSSIDTGASTGAWGSTASLLSIGHRILFGLVTSGEMWDGPVGEVIMTSHAMSSDERALLDAYLAKKWGF